MNNVEVMAVSLHEQRDHLPEQIIFNQRFLTLRQGVVDAAVCTGGVQHPHVFIQRLVKDLARRVAVAADVAFKTGIDVCVSSEHPDDIITVFLFAGNQKQATGQVNMNIILLMAVMLIAAPFAVPRHFNAHLRHIGIRLFKIPRKRLSQKGFSAKSLT